MLEVQAKLLGGAEFLLPLQKGRRILDVGCSTGAIAREVAVAVKIAPGEVIGIDRNEPQIEMAKRLAATNRIKNAHF